MATGNREKLESCIAAIRSVTSSGASGLAESYEQLAVCLEAEGRFDEAVVCCLAASQYASSGEATVRLAAREMELRRSANSAGILAEHTSASGQKLRYRDYPAFVRIETLAQCNAACVFCPYPGIARKGTRMSDSLVDKLISDLRDIPSSHKFGLSFHHMSEPFIDKRFPALVGRVERELPQATVIVNTNGSALTAAHIDFLRGAVNVGEIHVSFNDHRPNHYAQVMDLNFERTVDNIDALHSAIGGLKRLKVVIRRVGDGSVADNDFVAFCAERWPRFHATSKIAKDFLGQIEMGPSSKPIGEVALAGTVVMNCSQWYQMSITAEGKVAVCCFDGKAEWVIGDVTAHHVLDVYRSTVMRRFRDASFTRLEAPAPCQSCSIYWSGKRMNTADYAPS